MSTENNSYNERAFEHGWQWFRYHAEQRLTVIRFYLVLIVAIAAGYLTAFEKDALVACLAAAIFGVICSTVFYFLDRRVSDLVKLGEGVLAKEQEKLKTQLGYDEILIVENANKNKRGYFNSYSRAFHLLFLASGIMFGMGALYAIITISLDAWTTVGSTHNIVDTPQSVPE